MTPRSLKQLSSFIYVAIALVTIVPASRVAAFTVAFQEQGGLNGLIVGGGGSLSISNIGPDHWQITLQDSRIGNPTGPSARLAFIEPETVSGFTAYNNIQMLSLVPGVATFDILSDEFSPYATIVPNAGTAIFQPTDMDNIFLKFTDFADSVPEPGAVGIISIGLSLLWLKRRTQAH
jgi:hypothetical protein